MIAVDVMGGDYSPQAILHGAYLAAQQGVPVALFGPEQLISASLTCIDQSWQKLPITLFHSSAVIAMDDEPVAAVKKGLDTSLVKAVESVKKGVCTAALSAGNSGALMVASMMVLGKEEGVDRVPIAGFLPTLKGKVVALDLGANTECRPQHLLQFALQGVMYARENLGIASPKVGLLANGQEDTKGSALVKEAFKLLKDSELFNFVGNVEPEGVVIHRNVDVIICDGFSGNILLKTMESVYDVFINVLQSHAPEMLTLESNNKVMHAVHQFSPREQAGAVLLGVKGNVVVCHGNSQAPTIAKAIQFAYALPVSLKTSKKTAEMVNF